MSLRNHSRAPSVDSRCSRHSHNSVHSNWVCDNCQDFDRKDHREKLYRNMLDRQIAHNNSTQPRLNSLPGITGLLVGREMVEDPEVMLREVADRRRNLMNNFQDQMEAHAKTLKEQDALRKSGGCLDMFATSTGHYDREKDTRQRRNYMQSLNQQIAEKRSRSEAPDRRSYATGLHVGEIVDPSWDQIKTKQKAYGQELLLQQKLDKSARVKDNKLYVTSLDTGNVDQSEARRRNAQRIQEEWKNQIEQRRANACRMSPDKLKDREWALKQAKESNEDAIRDLINLKNQQQKMKADLTDQMTKNENQRRNNAFHSQHPDLCACVVCHKMKPSDTLKWIDKTQVADILSREKERTSKFSNSNTNKPITAHRSLLEQQQSTPPSPLKQPFAPLQTQSTAAQTVGSTSKWNRNALNNASRSIPLSEGPALGLAKVEAAMSGKPFPMRVRD
eukprot:GDKJ01049612.1.p1 GENE.GDKJ01049612.1~~GDKJ01049612.1.p1  ORF type:complete len:447 (+),score=99.15 GDKJ01049612.1:50-1390(+)